MSTPAGRLRPISALTVFAVGSMMSMSRLWVLISNCSRESLSTCGPRMTVKRSIRVGKGIGPATLADSETQPFLDSHRVNQLDLHYHVVPGHHHLHPFG